jgi:hypothetical protein
VDASGHGEDMMNEASRAQGWAICGAAGLAALLFVIGLLNGSYWALAIPVAIVTLFGLGLIAWVGYTIATIQVEADAAPEILSTDRAPEDASDPARGSRRAAEDAA